MAPSVEHDAGVLDGLGDGPGTRRDKPLGDEADGPRTERGGRDLIARLDRHTFDHRSGDVGDRRPDPPVGRSL